jgi:N-acetylglucosamine kinase-like BadF-type ATPase/plasmid maintenance system antidote protein VapI
MEKNQILDVISKNLKKLLNETGLSPSTLTKKCKVSAGSLSRILRGNMSITIPMAMEIAEGLKVGLDDLLEGLMMEKSDKKESRRTTSAPIDPLSIGILSINNKRVTCIKNCKNKIIGTSELEGGLDLTETSGNLLGTIQESIFAASPKLHVDQSQLKTIKLNLVIQSFEFEETKIKFKAFAERHFKEVMLLSDWQISYLSSFKNKHNMSLIVDKGVSLSYRHNGEIKKLGGWKFPVYDLGGENWLGVETVRHTIEAKEGYISMSDLARNILAKFNGKIEKITEICFKRNDPDIYCLFTESLLKSYLLDDSAAKSIIKRGFKLIYQLVDKVDSLMEKKQKVVLSGSLADIYKIYFKPERLISSSTEAEKASLLAGLTKEILSAYGVNS